MHQIPDGAQDLLPTIPGGIVADTRNTLRSGEQGLSLGRVSLPACTSPISTTNEFQNSLFASLEPASGRLPIVAAKQQRSWAGKAACRKGRV